MRSRDVSATGSPSAPSRVQDRDGLRVNPDRDADLELHPVRVLEIRDADRGSDRVERNAEQSLHARIKVVGARKGRRGTSLMIWSVPLTLRSLGIVGSWQGGITGSGLSRCGHSMTAIDTGTT